MSPKLPAAAERALKLYRHLSDEDRERLARIRRLDGVTILYPKELSESTLTVYEAWKALDPDRAIYWAILRRCNAATFRSPRGARWADMSRAQQAADIEVQAVLIAIVARTHDAISDEAYDVLTAGWRHAGLPL